MQTRDHPPFRNFPARPGRHPALPGIVAGVCLLLGARENLHSQEPGLSAAPGRAEAPAAPGTKPREVAATLPFDRVYPLSGAGRVSLFNPRGSVRVVAAPAQGDGAHTVRVQGVCRDGEPGATGGVHFEVAQRLNALRIRSEHDRGAGTHPDASRVDYTLTVPADARLLDFELGEGDLEVEGALEVLEVRVGHGSLRARGLHAREVSLKTQRGALEVDIARLTDGARVSLEAVSEGDVTLRLSGDPLRTGESGVPMDAVERASETLPVRMKVVAAEGRITGAAAANQPQSGGGAGGRGQRLDAVLGESGERLTSGSPVVNVRAGTGDVHLTTRP